MTMKEHRKLIWSFFSSLALVIPVALLPGCGKDDEPVHLCILIAAWSQLTKRLFSMRVSRPPLIVIAPRLRSHWIRSMTLP